MAGTPLEVSTSTARGCGSNPPTGAVWAFDSGTALIVSGTNTSSSPPHAMAKASSGINDLRFIES
jgi:hypothetical protein